MGIAFWIRRAATVFVLIAALLLVVSLLKGRGLLGGLAFASVWASLSRAVFIGARLYQSSQGQRCELCRDVPDTFPDSVESPDPSPARHPT